MPRALLLPDCLGPQGGCPALQPPLLAPRLRPSQPCSALGPHNAGCHLPFWGGRRKGGLAGQAGAGSLCEGRGQFTWAV